MNIHSTIDSLAEDWEQNGLETSEGEYNEAQAILNEWDAMKNKTVEIPASKTVVVDASTTTTLDVSEELMNIRREIDLQTQFLNTNQEHSLNDDVRKQDTLELEIPKLVMNIVHLRERITKTHNADEIQKLYLEMVEMDNKRITLAEKLGIKNITPLHLL